MAASELHWKSVAEFEKWWKEHGREFRRLSVATPPVDYETITSPEWLRIADLIEAFQEQRKRWEALDA